MSSPGMPVQTNWLSDESITRYASIPYNSSRISFYKGKWTSVQTRQGDGLQDIYNELQGAEGGFKFSFTGSRFFVSASFVGNRSATCFVDGNDSGNCIGNFTFNGPGTPGKHEVDIQYNGQLVSDGMQLRNIAYLPEETEGSSMLSEENFADTDIVFSTRDRNLTWTGGWDLIEGFSTRTPGTSMSMTFHGSGISVLTPSLRLRGSSRTIGGSYTLDDDNPRSFEFVDPPGSEFPIIDISDLCIKTHTLKVEYTGEPDTNRSLPIRDGIYIRDPLPNASSPPACNSNANNSSSSDQDSSPIPTPTPAQRTNQTPTIVGAVVGSVLGLALVAVVIFFLKRRNRSQNGPPDFETRIRSGIVNPYLESDGPGKRVPGKKVLMTSSGNLTGASSSAPSMAVGRRHSVTGDMEEPEQHVDSGIRLGRRAVPPVYTTF